MNPIYVVYGMILLVWMWREGSAFFMATNKNIDEVFELQKEFPELKKALEEKNELKLKELYDRVKSLENSLATAKRKYEAKNFKKNKDGAYSQRSSLGKEIHSTAESVASADRSHRTFRPETVDEPASLLANFFSKRLSSRLIAPITILGFFIPQTSDASAVPLIIGFISYMPLRLMYRFIYRKNFRKLKFPSKGIIFFTGIPHFIIHATFIMVLLSEISPSSADLQNSAPTNAQPHSTTNITAGASK